tara:strand:+ start:107 stop:703 length:597 start_codon:yes stop_codon:yes gene_type:complete
MKIYFDGCSMTNGKNYLDNYLQERYSALVASHFDAEENNFSIGGASNNHILRNFTVENFDSLSEYDLIVIQMTFRARTEYYQDKNVIRSQWRNINPKTKLQISDNNFWNKYYKDIYTDKQGRSFEQSVYNTIKAICELKQLPLVLLNVDQSSTLPYDITITSHYDRIRNSTEFKNDHPNSLGHQKLAYDVIQIAKQRL